jgi:hypothetical protein
MDSGANKHLSVILSLFSDLIPVDTKLFLADGSSWPVLVKCVVNHTNFVSLPSSLYVLDFPFNLLYVSQLTKALQCEICFFPTSCIFQDLKTKKMIGSGHE